ncbi:MAG: zinc-binding dehydrogenase [Pseudomonadales bacterium]|nr:zinc-binding dehydrogenase [Pseudomonadales bacterium]
MATTGLQIRSNITKEGMLEIALVDVPVPEPTGGDVLIRIEATPINPSDLGLLVGPADLSTAEVSGDADHPVVRARVPQAVMPAMGARIDQPMPVGNEGAGTVIAAGDDPDAQALVGKTVAFVGGAMYAQYRVAPARDCLVLLEGTTAKEGASCFVNPLTALGMVETMHREGHKALVHTAAASNLGQMLVKICLKDGVDLVNIVRKPQQVELLKSLGAKYVVNSSEPDFMEQLTDALAKTGATIAFDATGGGNLASQILTAMEAAANRAAGGFSRYGSTVYKQVYIYGGLDRSPTTLIRNYGMSWGLGGWLLTPFLIKIGQQAAGELRSRVAREIKTTFASSYSHEVSLAQALSLEALRDYGAQATGRKYLICPQS